MVLSFPLATNIPGANPTNGRYPGLFPGGRAAADTLTAKGNAYQDSPQEAATASQDSMHEWLTANDVSINDKLASLRLDELVTLGQSGRTSWHQRQRQTFLEAISTPLFAYIKYLYVTWTNIILSGLSFHVPLRDWLLCVSFAAFTSVILFFALIWCQFANSPLPYSLYEAWARRYAHGLGLVNAADPNLFSALTENQLSAAKAALNRAPLPSPAQSGAPVREFNLDIAKLLLQFASIVYERKSGAVHGVLDEVTKHSETQRGNGKWDQAWRKGRGIPTDGSAGATKGVAVESAARWASKGDEGASEATRARPGDLVTNLFDSEQQESIRDAFQASRSSSSMQHRVHEMKSKGWDKGGKEEDVIRSFCKRIQVGYEPVSELNTSTSAFCSFFWEPKGNWIVVTFKGTGIIEYADWVADLTTTLVPCGDFLPGFSQVVQGFKERIWPDVAEAKEDIVGGVIPWDTIRFSLIALANHMVRDLGDGAKINVWFTGHSLGCALATLAYTRVLNSLDFANTPIVIRDAYIFAAPVCGNRDTSEKFNEVIKQGEYLKTIWRVTNGSDAIATLLPQLGDNPKLKLSPTNPAGFAHIGAEIKMKDHPQASNVAGSLFSNTTIVKIQSAFSSGEVQAARDSVLSVSGVKEREAFETWAEKIPLIGRFIAHDTVLYWDQLDRIALGECEWLET